MRDLKLGAIFPLLLFFTLVIGIIIIFREEIEKWELFGKLHTTPIPEAVFRESVITPPTSLDSPDVPSLSVPGDVEVSPVSEPLSASPSLFFGNPSIRFGSGRIVGSDLEDITVVLDVGADALHTIPSGVSNYYASAFVEESALQRVYSPHSGSVVFLDRVSSVKASRPDREFAVLLASNILSDPVAITGWNISDRQNGVSYTVPDAVRVLGSGGSASPIVIHPGDAVVISSGGSPVGSSFRVNKCSGYRSQHVQFVPTVKTSCPTPVEEFSRVGDVPFSDSECYEKVISTPICTEVSDIPEGVSSECRRFFRDVLTEEGCVAAHRNTPDFFSPEWRVFLNSDTELWENRDNVLYLADEDDLLVATLVYQ